jgi:hypothetical protein
MSFDPTHEERFNRAIYLYYVGIKEDNTFKKVSKEDFNRLLEHDLQTKKTIEFDQKNIYRLADEKVICLGKYGKVLGEIWKEKEIESHWIHIMFL